MSNSIFTPKVWSTRLLAHLDAALVYGDIANKEYEGEIKGFGDTVKINQIGNVTVGDFDGEDIGAPEELSGEQTFLKIDKKKFFNFKVGDIAKVQSNVKLLDEGMKRAGLGVQAVIDSDIATSVEEAGIVLDEVALTVANTYDTIVDVATALDEANVPTDGRFIVLPPFALGLLGKDPRFTRNEGVLHNGIQTASIAGLDVRVSNRVPVVDGKYSVLAGHKTAIAYAGQISSIETYRPEGDFSDAVKGLYVYGTKVIQPKALVKLVVTKEVL